MSDERSEQITTTEARAGYTPHMTRYVLGVGLALVIVGLGIAGVVALSVSLRTGEIGIRMSLGADGSRVQRMVLGEGWVWLAGGLLLGIACRVRETVYRRLLGHR